MCSKKCLIIVRRRNLKFGFVNLEKLGKHHVHIKITMVLVFCYLYNCLDMNSGRNHRVALTCNLSNLNMKNYFSYLIGQPATEFFYYH